jgi:hypothetical protein
MTERTEALIEELARDLHPVRRLPGLGRVAARVAVLAMGLVGAQLVFAWTTNSPWLKLAFAPVDAWTIAAHALLAAGALAIALGACVPGRARLMRTGALLVAVALGAVVWIGFERLAVWSGLAALAPGWLGTTFTCSLGAIVPAALPALLLAHFAARAAPRHVALALLFGAAAPLGLLTQPGVLGCAYPDELHHVLGHLLTPVFGALILGVSALPVFLISRPSRRASARAEGA